jgi:hypothetical protein
MEKRNWIYTIVTDGGNLVDIVGEKELISKVTSPHYVLAQDVEKLAKRVKELGYDQVKKEIVPQLIKEKLIRKKDNPPF